MLYLITYDRRPGIDYKPIHDAIKKNYPDHWHALESVWLVVSNNNATQVADSILGPFDEGDKLIVTQMTNNAAWWGLSEDGSEWVKKRI